MEKILSWLPIIFLGVMGAVVLLFLNGVSQDNLLASGALVTFSGIFGGWAAIGNIKLIKIAGDENNEIDGWFSDTRR